MSEMLCPLCNAQSPENALYCQQCGQPLKCKDCGAELLPTALACIQCGKLIPERSSNDQFYFGTSTVPPGYNRLKLHETLDVRDVDLTVSNEALANIGDYLPSFIGISLKGNHGSFGDHQPQKQPDLVEGTSEVPPPQPQLPAASRPVLSEDSSGDPIWEIFRKQDDGGLKQDIQKLRASSRRDYTIRLIYLYLYAKLQLGEKTASRTEIYTILNSVGLKDGNTANNINQATGISSDDNETLWLNHEGREKVQQYIADVFNSDLIDSWYPGVDTHSPSTRIKKPNKKSSEHHSNVDANVAGWVSHEETKALVGSIQPSEFAKLSILDKLLIALYGISNVGTTQEVPIAPIAEYLYGAFEVSIPHPTISSTFYKARKAKTTFVNYRDGSYRITRSGREYVEKLLNLKQSQLAATEVNVGSNGAV